MVHIYVVTIRRKNCESITQYRERNNELENMKINLRLIRATLQIHHHTFVLKHGQHSNW